MRSVVSIGVYRWVCSVRQFLFFHFREGVLTSKKGIEVVVRSLEIPSKARCIKKEFVTSDLGKAVSTRHNKIIAKTIIFHWDHTRNALKRGRSTAPP